MAKTYTKTQVNATGAMLLILKADRILAKDRASQAAIQGVAIIDVIIERVAGGAGKCDRNSTYSLYYAL